MSYFNTGKMFLVPSLELEVKEREKIDKLLSDKVNATLTVL